MGYVQNSRSGCNCTSCFWTLMERPQSARKTVMSLLKLHPSDLSQWTSYPVMHQWTWRTLLKPMGERRMVTDGLATNARQDLFKVYILTIEGCLSLIY